MKPIGYEKNAWDINDTTGFISQQKGRASSRGARKDKAKYTRYLKRGEKHKHNIVAITNSLDQ
jgi:hypothetical protein